MIRHVGRIERVSSKNPSERKRGYSTCGNFYTPRKRVFSTYRKQPRLIHRSGGTGDEFVDSRRDHRENDIRSVQLGAALRGYVRISFKASATSSERSYCARSSP